MKKQILAASLLAFAAAAHADLLAVSGFGGYTTVSMKALNDTLDLQKASRTNVSKDTRPSGGYVAGVDISSGLLIPIPFTAVAFRGELVGAQLSNMAYDVAGLTFEDKNDALLTNAMLGLEVSLTPPLSPVGFGLGAYGGYGYAVVKASSTNPLQGNTQYTGGGFVGELEAKLKFSLIPLLSFDLFGNMRFANISSMTDGKNNAKDGKGGDLAFDFSGFGGGAGLTLSF